jgi:hypothetical protein
MPDGMGYSDTTALPRRLHETLNDLPEQVLT